MPQFHLKELNLINAARVAHMATADNKGRPHVIPICFACDGQLIYSVLDRKPKRTTLTALKRVRNILSNPEVALVVDHYEEDWGRLWYVLVTGTAQLIEEGEEHEQAIKLLREKYRQYRSMDIDENPIIKMTPTRVICWGKLPENISLVPNP